MKLIKKAIKKIGRKIGNFFRNVPKVQNLVNIVSKTLAVIGNVGNLAMLFGFIAGSGEILLVGMLVMIVCYGAMFLVAPIANACIKAARKCEQSRNDKVAEAMQDPNLRKVVGLIRNAESNEKLGHKEAAASFRAKAEQLIEKYNLDRKLIATAA